MAGKSRFLNLIRPLLRFVPEVKAPDRRVPFRQKLAWTASAVFIFLVYSQIRLFGIRAPRSVDPFYWLRVIIASNRGTLMELGISPVVTSSMVLQFLAGARLLDFDQTSKEDKTQLYATQKLFGMVLTLVQAVTYVSNGMYGDVADLGAGNCILLVAQLTISSVVMIYLDEMLQKGYGFGSGISLFIATNICESIVWKALSPATIDTGTGPQFEGAIVSSFHLFFTKRDKIGAIREAFYRQTGPNLTSLLTTVLMFFVVVYCQGIRVELSVKYQKMRGQMGSYPIKLFYASNMPIILQSAVVSNVYFFSQVLYKRFSNSFLVNILGQWREVEYIKQSVPVGGLVYYMSPPQSLGEVVMDPLHTVLYVAFMLTTCGLMSKFWIEVTGTTARDVARQLREQHVMMPGYRDSDLSRALNRYIPTAATTGGVIIAALTIVADFLGAIGSGTGILLAVTIIYGVFESMYKEREAMQGPAF